jgi:hypothetical protein
MLARTNRRRFLRAIAAALPLACAACTLLLDHRSTQCQSDDDCARFGSHPFCQSGVCVPSGLGPPNCLYGPPQRPEDFLNECSLAACFSFDNCKRIGLCGDAGGLSAPLIDPPVISAPPPGDAGTSGDAEASGDTSVAPPSCLDGSQGRPRIMVMTGSSNFPPLLSKLAPLLLTTGFTPVYLVTNSCTGVKIAFGAQPSDHVISDPIPDPSAKYATYFRQDGSSAPCSLGPDGAQVDVAESDIFSSTCGFGAAADGVGEYVGPIQSMAFVVPGKSQQTAITAEAARAVFGMGGYHNIAQPWIDPSLYFVRNANTGTQQMIAHAINVPASAFWGTDRGTAANVDAQLRLISEPTAAERAIGIISTDFSDSDRANLKALAFGASGQDCAYLPDSTEFKRDKQNVRNGHYPIWGPLHFFTSVSSGDPVSPGAQAFVNVVLVPNVAPALLDAFIASSLVPSCAMSVQRSAELGPMSPYSPPFQCGCYFEASPSVNGSAPPECARCNTANDCRDPARPACNLGYCEVR